MKRIYEGKIKSSGTEAMKEAAKKAAELKKDYPGCKITFGTVSDWSKNEFKAVVEID